MPEQPGCKKETSFGQIRQLGEQRCRRREPHGLTQDDAGRLFRDVNTDPLYVDYTAPRYFMRNPNATRTSGLYSNLVDQEESAVWPVRPTLGVNRGYREEVPRPDGSAYYYQGVSNPMIYRGDRLPKEMVYERELLICRM